MWKILITRLWKPLDKRYLNIFYMSSNTFTDKIILQKLDRHTFETVDEPICIYTQAILNRRTFYTLPNYINAFKTPQGWNVFFQREYDNMFHWVQVPE